MIAIDRLYYLLVAPNDAIYQIDLETEHLLEKIFVGIETGENTTPALYLSVYSMYIICVSKMAIPKKTIAQTASHVQFMIIWVVSKPMAIRDFPSNCLMVICRHCQAMFEDCCVGALRCFIQTQ